MPEAKKTYFEYRGVRDAVYAEVTQDDSEGFVTGTVKKFAGLAEIGKSTESSNDTHYYDNVPAVVISSTGADTLQISASGIPNSVIAELTGQYYDEDHGMFVEEERTPKNFAFGYVTNRTDGTDVYVWRLKGAFSVPDQNARTQDAGTDANGQSLTFTGISTAHKFTKTGKPAKAVNIETAVYDGMTESAFFATVQTPDTIAPANP